MHCKWPIRRLHWYSPLNYSAQHHSEATWQVAWHSVQAKTNIYSRFSPESVEMPGQRSRRVSSLTLVIMTRALRSHSWHPTTLTPRLRRPGNQCDVILHSSPESWGVVGTQLNFDPVWKGNLSLWWWGHAVSLHYWHSWLTQCLHTHNGSDSAVIEHDGRMARTLDEHVDVDFNMSLFFFFCCSCILFQCYCRQNPVFLCVGKTLHCTVTLRVEKKTCKVNNSAFKYVILTIYFSDDGGCQVFVCEKDQLVVVKRPSRWQYSFYRMQTFH